MHEWLRIKPDLVATVECKLPEWLASIPWIVYGSERTATRISQKNNRCRRNKAMSIVYALEFIAYRCS
ncbi:hypothetical protein GQ600_2948 [Phytophthora cactorum]|nr:hypothetical protein GQ600_2948 [Phytophthora cactorum]